MDKLLEENMNARQVTDLGQSLGEDGFDQFVDTALQACNYEKQRRVLVNKAIAAPLRAHLHHLMERQAVLAGQLRQTRVQSAMSIPWIRLYHVFVFTTLMV